MSGLTAKYRARLQALCDTRQREGRSKSERNGDMPQTARRIGQSGKEHIGGLGMKGIVKISRSDCSC